MKSVYIIYLRKRIVKYIYILATLVLYRGSVGIGGDPLAAQLPPILAVTIYSTIAQHLAQ